MQMQKKALLGALILFVGTGHAWSQEMPRASLNLFGVTGLIDMPTAEGQPDGELSATISYFPGTMRNTLTFQITPRLSGSFRYTALLGWLPTATGTADTYDRSFDVRYQILREGRFRPAVAVGVQDIIGTGIYSAEYLVATKHISPNLKLTGGIGWGRLGSYNSFTNPLSAISSSFNTRNTSFGLGGVPGFGAWFRGPAAFFAGVEWQTPVKGLTLKAEYSSDAYVTETATLLSFSRRSPFNFALNYQFESGNSLSGYYLYGSELGVSFNLSINPRKPANVGSLGPAPVPVYVRPKGRTYDTAWMTQPDGAAIIRENIQILLAKDGQQLETLALGPGIAEIRFRNNRYGAAAQAVGRAARALARALPASIETFVITPIVEGMPAVSFTLSRTDIETFEHAPDGAAEILARARITDGSRQSVQAIADPDLYPQLSWSLSPYADPSLFDPDQPVRVDVGLRLSGRYEIRPGLILSASIRKKLAGNLNSNNRPAASVLPHVRTDFRLYHQQGDPALDVMTAEYFFRPGRNLYGRVTFGYLERMYGGISTEILWQRPKSNFALGAEVNYVRQRAYNLMLGFLPYSVITGHVSGYLDLNNGYTAQLDVGRYLAGDWGATLALDRSFDNGWKVGAFFTLTNVPFATFGEGSFDKGLRFTIPISWFSGKPSRKKYTSVIRPITRDGGARLDVPNRLYDLVSEYRGDRLLRRGGRFWR